MVRASQNWLSNRKDLISASVDLTNWLHYYRNWLKITFFEPWNLIFQCSILCLPGSFHGLPTDWSRTPWVKKKNITFNQYHCHHDAQFSSFSLKSFTLNDCLAPCVTLPWFRCLEMWCRRDEWGSAWQHFLTLGSLRIWRASRIIYP